ncbi:hypothetical protein [Flavobacterium phragmitis]|uniref:Uncharacterized protein n=1 Tax=Flavobacterium phragmitis TaxID=739143 RepID=A0A1I1QWX3_9FLAO|nr:hypothetical protein [Flavobacterium phragmitis]SFD26586.1 hypothetical protein SAMN05216297_106122 [Flavobacterium phragmitis]
MVFKRIKIVLIIIANLGFLWAIYNMFYYKKASFDTSEKAQISTDKIIKISSEAGNWEWNKINYDFYKEFYFDLNKNEIIEFCKIANSSNAKYIENIRAEKWIEIEIKENTSKTTIYLKQNIENEVYFEINHKTFEGKELEKYIQKHIREQL